MMIVMREGASEQELGSVIAHVESTGARAHVIRGDVRTVIGAIGDREPVADLALEGLTHLPVIVDPSHAAGRRELVPSMALAAAAAGADGIIVEVHPDPEHAVCDGPQQLHTDGFADLLRRVEQAAELAGKCVPAVV